MTRLAIAASLAIAIPAVAGPGHGHGKGLNLGKAHGHAHGHDHGAERGAHDPRAPLFGSWNVDVAETASADPKIKAADARARARVQQSLGGMSLTFAPEGGVVISHPQGRRRGIFTARIDGERVEVTIVDAHQNSLETSRYDGTLRGDRMQLQHEGSVVVLRRTGVQARPSDRKSLPMKQAKPIFGDWAVDVEATLAADDRLKTLTAEQQKTVKDSARAFLSGARFGWKGDGTATIGMGDETRNRTWRLLEKKGSQFTIEVTGDGPTETITLESRGKRLHMLMGPRALILMPQR